MLGDAESDVPTWTCQSSPIHHENRFQVPFSSGVTTECAITKGQLAEMGSAISTGGPADQSRRAAYGDGLWGIGAGGWDAAVGWG